MAKGTNMKRVFAGLLAATLVWAAAPALAQSDYPSKPVKLIIPFPVGGTSDIMGRMAADELTKALKQPLWSRTSVALEV